MEQTITHIGNTGLIAIVRGRFTLDQLSAIGETLATAGVTVLEITLNTSNALAAIEQLRRRFEGTLIVGAGTVRTVDQFRDAIVAGAKFTVAPNFDPATVAAALAHEILHLPGVFTATEAETAHRAGCRLLKLFPSDMFGPAYLRALRAPLDDVRFVPTGGITAANAGQYRRAGAFACGLGSALITGPDQPLSELAQRARDLRLAWDEAAV
jgi:2-dehydro-3-deoxyphosphogluconate aldolase / (4S)-4-hydroxy-2-oxoglutarate aldolase